MLKETNYRKTSLIEEAPQHTDCVTSLVYIFRKTQNIEMPITFIGDLPRLLLTDKRWHILYIDRQDIKCGDLLFVKEKSTQKLISHLALCLDNNEIFHCNKKQGTTVIQSWDTFFSSYEQKLNGEEMIRYIDQRSTLLRMQHGGIYIKE